MDNPRSWPMVPRHIHTALSDLWVPERRPPPAANNGTQRAAPRRQAGARVQKSCPKPTSHSRWIHRILRPPSLWDLYSATLASANQFRQFVGAFAGRAQATYAATQALRATLGPRPSDLDAVLSIVDQIPSDQPAAHRRRQPEGGERWQLQCGRDEREHRDTGREPAGADVSRSLARRVPDEVDYPDALDDVRQEIEGEAAAERGCRDHTQRLIDVLDGFLQAECEQDDPGDHRQVQVAVEVARELGLRRTTRPRQLALG